MKRLQIPQKLVYRKFDIHEKFYVHEIASVYLSKNYFLKNAKKTCKPNNRDLNRDWKIAHIDRGSYVTFLEYLIFFLQKILITVLSNYYGQLQLFWKQLQLLDTVITFRGKVSWLNSITDYTIK